MSALREPAGKRSQTPRRLSWLWDEENGVNDALAILGALAEITFPLPRDEQSPAKKNKSPAHEIKRLFSQLYFTKREGLEHELLDFIDYLDGRTWNNEHRGKLQYLQKALSAVNGEHVRYRQSPHANRVIPPATAQETHGAPAYSPTILAKHAPASITGSMEAMEISPSNKITSNTTSANTSFSSEAQNGSQDPPTPATEVDEEFTKDQGSPQGAGSMSKFQDKMAAAGVPVAQGHSGPGFDGALDVWNTQETYYGSSPRESQIPDDIDLQWRDSTLSQSSVDVTESSKDTVNQSSGPKVEDSSAVTTHLSTDNDMRPALEAAPKRLSDGTANELLEPLNHDTASEAEVTAKKTNIVAEHVRVRNIVRDGLTHIELPSSILGLEDIERRSAFYLVVQDCKVDPEELAQRWKEPRTLASLHELACSYIPGFRSFSKFSYGDRSLRAKARLSDSRAGRLIQIDHVRPQAQHRNRFERKFGCHRFLTVDVEALKPLEPLGLAGQADNIQSRLLEMWTLPLRFLGCDWLQFYAQEKSQRKAGEELSESGMQFTLFAIRGRGIPPIRLCTVLDWWLNFQTNQDMSVCKLYARLDVAMSRTQNVRMYPSEIGFKEDIHAKDDSEDAQVDNLQLQSRGQSKGPVMTDGCTEADPLLLQFIREALDEEDEVVAAQVRGPGIKGMIFKERPNLNNNGTNIERFASRATTGPQPCPLVRFTESMRKVKMPFQLPSKDFSETSFDAELLELGVVQVARPPKPSYLYSDFIPILVGRQVPAATIERLAELHARKDQQDFLEALSSSDGIRDWLYRQNSAREDRRRDTEIQTLAGFPTIDAEKAIQMLDSGFEPTELEALANIIRSAAEDVLNYRKKAYKIPLDKSVMPLTVVDVYGILNEDEIQVNFSQGFRDPVTGRRIPYLTGYVLISRLPACRPSDIRRVKAVYRPELSHLMDVAIFPTTGKRPLADLCSGGDYDGDKFWICREPSLVDAFENATVPASLPDPKSMGIKVDNRATSEVVSDPCSEAQVREFVRLGTANRSRGSLLGTVTKLLERQIYADNNMSTRKAKALADLKNTIIDSDKMGYIFTHEDLARFKRDHGIGPLQHPAYSKPIGKKNNASTEHAQEPSNVQYAEENPDNILDIIHCGILPQIFKESLLDMESKLANASRHDDDLVKEYDDTLASAAEGTAVHFELLKLKDRVEDLWKVRRKQVDLWKQARSFEKGITWERAVLHCRGLFDEIQPANPEHPIFQEWLRPNGSMPTRWQLIKASAVAKFFNLDKMWFCIAGRELCWMKARKEQVRPVRSNKYNGYKPRRRKRVIDEVDHDEPGAADENDVEMEE